MPRRAPQLAKLTRPRLARAVRRERLFDRLDQARANTSAICVVGPPGAGKTTLVASWLDARGIDGIWYQVDAGDADLATCFYYLGQAAKRFSDRAQRPLPLLTPEHLGDVEGFSRRYFRALFSRLPEGATAVFDNYQEVAANQRFHGLVADALEEIPDGITLIVISRRDPPQSYARLVANERVSIVDWEGLKLQRDEAQAIATERVAAASPEIIARLHGMSEGWAAGFTLLVEQLRQGQVSTAVDQCGSIGAVFDYFAGQLFERIAPDRQRLLLQLSYLPRMTARSAVELTGSADAAALLEDLHRRHLFIDRREAGEPVYQFHALLLAFLQYRAGQLLSLPEQTDVTQRAARMLEQSIRPEEALPLFLKSGAYVAAEALILREAPKLIGQGRWKVVVGWITSLPAERAEADCWLMHWLGAATLAAEPRNARRTLEKSFELAEQQEDELCQVQAAAGIIGSYMAEYAQFRPFDRWIGVLERKVTKDFPFEDPDAELRVQSALLIALAFRQPGNPRLANCVERVFALLQNACDFNLRASAATHLVRYGATTGPVEIGERALPYLEALLARPEVTPFVAALGFAAISWFHCLTRNPQACEAVCAQVERIAEEHGVAPLKNIFINRMWLALFDFDVGKAEQWFERLARVADHSHPFDLASLHGANAWMAVCRNEPQIAIEYGRKAVQVFDDAGSTMHSVNFRLSLVIAFFMLREFASARGWIQQMRDLAGDGLTSWQQSSLLMWEANIALAEGDREIARDKLTQALASARRSGAGFMLSNWGRPWMSNLCHEALSAGIEVAYVSELVRRYQFAPPSAFTTPWPWPIKIYALGDFRILRDDQALQFGRKAPRRILAVLKYIVGQGAEGVPLRQLADAVWSDEEGDAALRALGVALARLRKLLGSHDVLCVNDERVRINRELVWLDTLAFEHLVDNIDAQICDATGPELTNAVDRLLSIYRGDFLPADRDEVWALRPRLRMRARFVRCVTALGDQLEASSCWQLAVRCYLRGLETDDLAEEFYQGLMRSYAALDQPAQGLAAFERLRHTLLAALGVVPSSVSARLAQKFQPHT